MHPTISALLLCSITIGSTVVGGASPAGAGGDEDRVLIALSEQTGTEKWRAKPHGDDGGNLEVMYADDGLVVADEARCESQNPIAFYRPGDQAIVAFDAKTGAERWRATDSAVLGMWLHPDYTQFPDGSIPVYTPMAHGLSRDGTFQALNPETGKVRWSRSRHSEAFATMNHDVFLMAGPSSTKHNPDHLVALDRATGIEQWSADVLEGWGIEEFAISDHLIALLLSHHLRGFDVEPAELIELIDAGTGHRVAEIEITPRDAYQAIALVGDAVLVSGDRLVTAYDIATLEELWHHDANYDIFAAPYKERVVFVWKRHNGGELVALDVRDGSTMWTQQAGEYDQVTSASHTIVVTGRSVVRGLAPATGRERWHTSVPNLTTSSTAGNRGAYFAGGCNPSFSDVITD